jgi:hypothetical protein
MKTTLNKKELSASIVKWIFTCLTFLIALAVPYLILPINDIIMSETPIHGLIPAPFDMLLNAVVNGTLVYWFIMKSVYYGYRLFLKVLLMVFLVQTFLTQIETAYFIDAFPLLKGTFETYMLIFRGALTAVIFSGLAVLISGRFKNRDKKKKSFDVSTDRIVKKSLWLSAVYVLLYMLFGYYVAWQSRELRLFYEGPEQLNGIFDQWRNTLIEMPELPFFQYCRGFLWIACLIPVFRGFTGGKKELILFSALFLGLIPTIQLVYPNPLMPSGVSAYHFVEVSVSNGIFGALIALLIPIKIPSVIS